MHQYLYVKTHLGTTTYKILSHHESKETLDLDQLNALFGLENSSHTKIPENFFYIIEILASFWS